MIKSGRHPGTVTVAGIALRSGQQMAARFAGSIDAVVTIHASFRHNADVIETYTAERNRIGVASIAGLIRN